MRRQNSQIRTERASRNFAARQMQTALASVTRHRRDGEVSRGQGRGNHPYGARPGAKRSILTVHAHAVHGLKRYPTRNHDATSNLRWRREGLQVLDRPALRQVARDAGVKGWGKMTKAQMVEGILR